jgi:PAS domain S-box-containing protein
VASFPDEARTRRTLRDLVALSTLPAIWADYQPLQVAESLAEVLQNMLGLGFVYLRLRGQAGERGIEVARTVPGSAADGQAAEIGRALTTWLARPTGSAQTLPNPLGDGTVRIARVPLGWEDDGWVLVAGSPREDFPTVEERLLLSVGANQAAMVFQRQRTDEAVRLVHVRLALAVRGSSIGIWEIEMPDGALRNGRLDFTNVFELLGYDRPELASDFEARMTLVHPEDRGRLEEAIQAYLCGQIPDLEVEHRARHKDGSYRWMLTRGVATRDEAGVPVRMIGSSIDITDRRQAEEALRESEERFRGTFENAAVGIGHMDRTCHYIRVNRRFCEIVGYSREELREATCLQITHPDDMELGVDQFDALMRGELQSFSLEKRYLRKDGSPVWVNMSVSLQRDPAGHPAYAIEAIQDISDRKRAEGAMRESEARFRALAENVPSLVWSCNLDRQCDYANPQFMRYTGQSEAELLGDWRLDNIHPDDHAAMFAAWEHSMTTGGPAEFEARVRRHDGAWRWFQIRAAPVRDEQGRLIKAFGTNTDIDDLKRAQEALRLGEQRLGAELAAMKRLQEVSTRLVQAADSVPLLEEIIDAAIAITAADMGNIQLLDPASGTLRVVAGRGFRAEDLEAFAAIRPGECTCGTALERGERVVVEDVTTSPIFAGKPILDAMHAAGIRAAQSTPLISRSGRLVGMLSTHYRAPRVPAERDLGILDLLARQAADWIERTRAEDELRRAKEMAEAASRAKDEFLANVSHEIRTPFGAILGMTELVLDTTLTDEQRQCLETAKSAADSLLGLVEDLLDFEKIEAGKLELVPADFSLQAMMTETLRALTVRAHMKGLELACNVEPDVPDALVGDAGRLRQVLLNLVGNAIKFTRHGEVAVRVEVAESPAPVEEAVLRFIVRDTGIGIPPEGQERIFQAFEQADSSTTRKFGGTGLGLTIAARLVNLMEGEIGVESEPGRGSTFSFTARFRRQLHPPEHVFTRPSDVLDDAASTRVAASLRILVAEDSEFNSRHIERLLGRRGHVVRVATDGREALELVGEAAFDLLLLDLHMPELDGFQVSRAIRERERAVGGHLPVIALTARARPEDRERCLAAGMDDYLSKPVRAAELLATIDRVIAARGVSRPAPLDAGDAESPLDPAALLAACDGDAEALRELCQDFRAFAPEQIREVGDALRDGDAPRLREAAHKLYGLLSAFSTVGGSVASDLEQHAARGELDEARPLVHRLKTLVRELIRQLDGLSVESLRRRAATAGS